MAQMLVRKLDDGVKSGLAARARRNGRNLEAEVREILTQAAGLERANPMPEGLGTRLARRFAGIGFDDGEFERLTEVLREDWRIRVHDFGDPEFDR